MNVVGARGFTLVELMATLGIVAVVLGLGGFALVGSPRISPERADVYALLVQARQFAFLRHRCAVARFTDQTVDVTLHKAKDGGDCSPPFLLPPESAMPTLTLPTGAAFGNFSTTDRTLVFGTDGGLAPDVLVTFELKMRSGVMAFYRVYPAIGQVRVQ